MPDPDLTDSEFAKAVGERLTIVINASQNRRSVYSSERDRFDAILDAVMDGAVLSEADQAFKLKYEKSMSEDERLFFETKINLGLEARKEKTKWH